MKFRSIKPAFIMVPLLSLAAASCLKDNDLDKGKIQGTTGSNIKVVSLGINVRSAQNASILAYDNSTHDTTVNLVPVELGGPEVASQDIHVTLIKADSLVDSLNSANAAAQVGNTDYIVPTQVTIVDPVVTIKKGTRTGFLQVKFVPADLIGVDYAIGFRIKSVAEPGYTISGNIGTGVAIVLIKNKYDGAYSLKIESIGWAAYGIADGGSNAWPNRVTFETTGAASNIFGTTQGGNGQPAFTDALGTTSFGATTPQLTFDLATNKLVSVTNLSPDDGRGRNFHINPAVTTSRYDPATKTIYASYIMVQNGRPDQTFNDTLVYKGPR